MSNKPEMTRDEEEGKKASPVIPPSQHGQADCKVVERESVEMTPLKVHNESQGKHCCYFTLVEICWFDYFEICTPIIILYIDVQ